jgi:hypothetical protein
VSVAISVSTDIVRALLVTAGVNNSKGIDGLCIRADQGKNVVQIFTTDGHRATLYQRRLDHVVKAGAVDGYSEWIVPRALLASLKKAAAVMTFEGGRVTVKNETESGRPAAGLVPPVSGDLLVGSPLDLSKLPHMQELLAAVEEGKQGQAAKLKTAYIVDAAKQVSYLTTVANDGPEFWFIGEDKPVAVTYPEPAMLGVIMPLRWSASFHKNFSVDFDKLM